MKKKTIIKIILIAIIIGILITVGIVLHKKGILFKSKPILDKSHYTIVPGTLSVIVRRDNQPIQTLSLSSDGKAAIKDGFIPNPGNAFIIGDVNDDGYPDAAMVQKVTERGSSFIWDYYIFNPRSERLEKDKILSNIVNPKFDYYKKEITSTFLQDGKWWTKVFTLSGNKYQAQKPTPLAM